MNFNVNRAMKKIYAMIFVAAATLAGCQNVNDGLESDNQNKVEMKVGASVPTVSRTALTENAGVYKATWKAGDALNLVEVAGESVTTYESAALAGDTESANFSFELTAAEAESYTYLAVYPKGAVSNATANKFVVTLPATQSPAEMNTFDGAADILVSNAAESTVQGGSLALTMQRLSAVGKITVKNMPLAAGEVVKSVTFSCGHPLAGSATVKVDDLTYEVKQGIGEVKVVLPESQSGDFTAYFSCLPATLAAGDAYTVSVETSAATYHKVSTVASPLTLAAGAITSFKVNMVDSNVNTKISTDMFNDKIEYVVAFKDLNGDTYLLKRGKCERRPTPTKIATLGLSINSNGALVGEVPSDYCWSASARTDENGVVWGKFSYVESGVEYYLINTYYAQGVGISEYYANDPDGNTDGYDGVNGKGPYINEIRIAAKGDGYRLFSAGDGADLNLCVYSGGTQFRLLDTAGADLNYDGTVYFYKVDNASVQTSVYPVITDAAHITDGTYMLLFKNATSGEYFTMKNDMTLSAPAAIAIADAGLTMENDLVTAATEIADEYKWIFATNEDGDLNILSATNTSRFLRQRNNAGGIAVVTKDEYDAAKAAETINGVYESAWNFSVNATHGLQAVAGANERHLGVNGVVWAGFKASGICGSIVLVKLPSVE